METVTTKWHDFASWLSACFVRSCSWMHTKKKRVGIYYVQLIAQGAVSQSLFVFKNRIHISPYFYICHSYGICFRKRCRANMSDFNILTIFRRYPGMRDPVMAVFWRLQFCYLLKIVNNHILFSQKESNSTLIFASIISYYMCLGRCLMIFKILTIFRR